MVKLLPLFLFGIGLHFILFHYFLNYYLNYYYYLIINIIIINCFIFWWKPIKRTLHFTYQPTLFTYLSLSRTFFKYYSLFSTIEIILNANFKIPTYCTGLCLQRQMLHMQALLGLLDELRLRKKQIFISTLKVQTLNIHYFAQ